MSTQKNIVLCTMTARYAHTAFGLRYLFANLGPYQSQCQILEFITQKNPEDLVEEILKYQPKIVGFGIYIWNTTQMLKVVSILKKVAPEIIVVLGGPEISFETEGQPLTQLCDFVIQGEADFLFQEFCDQVLSGQGPSQKIISGPLPEIQKILLPYEFYTDEDIQNRIIYVEASRGCPFKCEYCLSSLDVSVRNFHLEAFLSELDKLIERGARQFKFVDRTFNLSLSISTQILEFFLKRSNLGLFLHFEMVPDRLPEELKKIIQQFPKGALQFEIGVQTMNPEVAKSVSRRQDYAKIKENFHFLQTQTNVHTLADLIIGLPGESFESFAKGFDELTSYVPSEIQIGILKKLKGTPIARHTERYSMVYSDSAPFQILKNQDLDYLTLQKLHRFSHYWDLIANSGNFLKLMEFFKAEGLHRFDGSLFALMWDLSEFLYKKHGQAHAISLANLQKSLKEYILSQFQLSNHDADEIFFSEKQALAASSAPKRQKKHMQT